jgi:hypothetical protein
MVYTVFPHIVSALEYVPPFNSFCSKNSVYWVKNWNFQQLIEFLQFPNSKKNSFSGNYSRKYGTPICEKKNGFHPQSRKNRGCLSLISNMGNQFLAIWAALKKLPKKIQLWIMSNFWARLFHVFEGKNLN